MILQIRYQDHTLDQVDAYITKNTLFDLYITNTIAFGSIQVYPTKIFADDFSDHDLYDAIEPLHKLTLPDIIELKVLDASIGKARGIFSDKIRYTSQYTPMSCALSVITTDKLKWKFNGCISEIQDPETPKYITKYPFSS